VDVLGVRRCGFWFFPSRSPGKWALAANELGRVRKAHLAQLAQTAFEKRRAEVAATFAAGRKIVEEA
jgi:hypothetical protein